MSLPTDAELDQADIPMAIIAPDGSLLRANDQFQQLIGTDQSLIGGFAASLVDGRAEHTEHSWQSHELRQPDGRDFAAIVSSVLIRRTDGQPAYVLTQIIDASRTAKDAASGSETEDQWRLAFDHAPIGIALSTLDGTLQRVNSALCRMLGRSAEELVGVGYREFSHLADVDLDVTYRDQLVRGEIESFQLEQRYLRPDGEVMWTSLSVSLMRDPQDRPTNLVAFMSDVGKRRAQTDYLRDLAARDPLTGLANRTALIDRLESAIQRASEAEPFAVAFLDMDGFKAINDRLGHGAGDELLRVVSRRLVGGLRSSDLAARFGGDEFVLLLQPAGSPQDLAALAERLLTQLSAPVMLAETTVELSASVGVVLGFGYPSSADLLAAADRAMYQAKLDGKNTYRIG
ncbi:MAG: hypothetical protein JWN95_2432 [Frankiales bacterium]|nr:hypothetical protein [Frankiales bacterium]